jgi:hypothetical protein
MNMWDARRHYSYLLFPLFFLRVLCVNALDLVREIYCGAGRKNICLSRSTTW